ncbi:septum formation inhibitor Maf [Bacillus lacus]|uniref:dTTP/UTP pyrophosphatase n=1 Tax=Metabacillus lacus TaxID=1983721 RepID=A0A7X2IXT0_9BACI|nr:Maf family protein [Metabacillus lacus]MRX71427.1 septum formation inhibitor Maf [Metabacillus lacus]
MEQQHLVLASGSPRRKEILENVGLSFTIAVSDIEEIIEEGASPSEAVSSLAAQKAQSIADRFQHSFVIGADTVVVLDGVILGKPRDKEEAFSMLSGLSGSTHSVLTGVCLMQGSRTVSFYESTSVTFYELSETEIRSYIESGEPMDKAGAYGIQGLGSLLVKELHGDYFSVVGLPVARTIRELKKFGFHAEKNAL